MDRHLPMSRKLATGAIVFVPVAFIGYFFVYPLATLLVTGLTGDTGSSLLDVLTSGTTGKVAWFTFWQAATSTVLTVLLGLPAAYVVGRYRFPGRRLVRALVTVPFVLPTVVVGAAFLALFGRQGALGIDLRGSIWAILIAHVFYNIAVVVRTVSTAWERLDPRLLEAARVLGANRRQVFRNVTLPLVAPAVASAGSIVFLFTFTSFGVILILGDIATSTLEVEIWRRATGFQDFGAAASLALLQLVGVTAILWLYSRYQQRRATAQDMAPLGLRNPGSTAERFGVAATIIATLVIIITPLAMLAYRSLTIGDGLGLGNYRALLGKGGSNPLLVPPVEAIANSLRFAVPAVAIAVTVGILAAVLITSHKGSASVWFDTILMLPLGTSAVTLGFGMLLALDEPIDLRTSLWLVPIAHGLIGLPFVVRASVPLLRNIRPQLREAAAVLGASPSRVWREIDLPLVMRAIAVGAGFALAVSLGEFGATNFLALPEAPTLPVAIFRLLGQPGTFGGAMALATILMVLAATAIILIEGLKAPGSDL